MKTLSILASLITFGTLVAAGETAPQERSTGQVSLRATDKTVRPEREKKKDDDKKDAKKDNKNKGDTVTKSIEVEISAAKSVNGPLKIVTHWIGRDLSAKKQAVAGKHEIEVTLDAAKTAKASVPPFSFTSVPAQAPKDGKGEKIPASGHDYSGWVIRAYEGTKLVGETASSAPLLKLRD